MFLWDSGASSVIQQMLAVWSLVPLPFINPACTSGSFPFMYCWSLAWRILHITLLTWNERNCSVVWTFFGTALLWNWHENWPFPVLCHYWVFQICWHQIKEPEVQERLSNQPLLVEQLVFNQHLPTHDLTSSVYCLPILTVCDSGNFLTFLSVSVHSKTPQNFLCFCYHFFIPHLSRPLAQDTIFPLCWFFFFS